MQPYHVPARRQVRISTELHKRPLHIYYPKLHDSSVKQVCYLLHVLGGETKRDKITLPRPYS